MSSIRIGGDPESYMDPPQMTISSKDGPSFIASILDLLGIHKQVANEESAAGTAEESTPQPQAPTPSQPKQPVDSDLPIITDMEAAFKPLGGNESMGLNSLRLTPFETFDPDSAF